MASVLAQWCVKFTFRDAKGQTRSIQICYQADNASASSNAESFAFYVAETVTNLQALSNAHVSAEANFQGGGAAQSGLVYGTAATYQSVSQQAKLVFLTTDPAGDPSNVGQISIPAPIESIFLADGITVNPANTNVAALVTTLTTAGTATAAQGCTKSGLLLTSLVGGTLVGKKLSRKWTKFTKDPTLTYSGI